MPAAKQKEFLEVERYLKENYDEQITINNLIDLMEQKLSNTKHMDQDKDQRTLWWKNNPY